MNYTAKNLQGFTLGATDGEIGNVEEFYFDDATWTIRYLVVKTGGWLSGRKVLISPSALAQPDWDNKVFPISLTKEQVKNSPDIDTEQPVSRQQEIELYDHYAWPYYGTAGIGFYGGLGMAGMVDSRVPLEDSISAQNSKREAGDPHLRSTEEVFDYEIHATDGHIGEVEDFIIDERTWSIGYLIVDTGNWFPGKKVILSPKWIKEVSWEDSSVYVDISIDTVKNSPEYDSSSPLQETYRDKLHDYYGRPF